MARRVRPGEKLNITAAEYNRLLAAPMPSLAIVSRVAEETAPTFATLPPFAFTIKVRPLCPSVESSVLTPHSAILTSTIQHSLVLYGCDDPICASNSRRTHGSVRCGDRAIAEDKVGRVVFAGVVAARVYVQETWHQYADVANSGGTTLQSKPNGSAQILWRRDSNQSGVQWAVIRVGKPADPAFLVKVPTVVSLVDLV